MPSGLVVVVMQSDRASRDPAGRWKKGQRRPVTPAEARLLLATGLAVLDEGESLPPRETEAGGGETANGGGA